MTVPGESVRVTLLVSDAFEQLGVRYAVGGSLSSSLHGVMRSTLDADIIADLQPEHIQPLARLLSSEFYVDSEMMLAAIDTRGCFNLVHYESAFKVDVFIPKRRPFDRSQLERRTPATVATDPERSLYVTSPEDVILSKLEWYHMGGEVSDRQWRDVLGVLKTRADGIDLHYLHHWAEELKVGDLLKRALNQSRS